MSNYRSHDYTTLNVQVLFNLLKHGEDLVTTSAIEICQITDDYNDLVVVW